MKELKHVKFNDFQEAGPSHFNQVGEEQLYSLNAFALAFMAGFNHSDSLIVREFDIQPVSGAMKLSAGSQGIVSLRDDTESMIIGIYNGDRGDFAGQWDASLDDPTIPAASSANKGQWYIVGVAGSTSIDGESSWQIGDWLISDGSQWLKNSYLNEEITVPAADSTDDRIDLIEVSVELIDDPYNFINIPMIDPDTESVSLQPRYTRRAQIVKLHYKEGVPSATPLAPTVTAGRMAIREVKVPAGATDIQASDIIAQNPLKAGTKWTVNHDTRIFLPISDFIDLFRDQQYYPIVEENGFGDYTFINQACTDLIEDKSFVVRAGVYEEAGDIVVKSGQAVMADKLVTANMAAGKNIKIGNHSLNHYDGASLAGTWTIAAGSDEAVFSGGTIPASIDDTYYLIIQGVVFHVESRVSATKLKLTQPSATAITDTEYDLGDYEHKSYFELDTINGDIDDALIHIRGLISGGVHVNNVKNINTGSNSAGIVIENCHAADITGSGIDCQTGVEMDNSSYNRIKITSLSNDVNGLILTDSYYNHIDIDNMAGNSSGMALTGQNKGNSINVRIMSDNLVGVSVVNGTEWDLSIFEALNNTQGITLDSTERSTVYIERSSSNNLTASVENGSEQNNIIVSQQADCTNGVQVADSDYNRVDIKSSMNVSGYDLLLNGTSSYNVLSFGVIGDLRLDYSGTQNNMIAYGRVRGSKSGVGTTLTDATPQVQY